ncbi:transporter substrate-binding domain-containing protein [Thalassolituus sp.]|uniref:substrate-binding periplasmic protein n=1 Tax=Thalassolituus sp. TaxID=2030822 RepID=UPI002A810758|nr:transporter substrate-binding domain-containing protein [Thalassolituus sp.]
MQSTRTNFDGSHRYYIDLLNKVMEASADKYGAATIIESPNNFSQNRGFLGLEDGWIDIFWAGSTAEREKNSQAIRIPLYAGLLGRRVPVIRRGDLAKFEAINKEGSLKALKACQGDQWPDSDILENAGYILERVHKFELMYNMLRAGRCDYFPRAITEVYAEIEGYGGEDLVVFDHIIISYPFPMYFFVAKDNATLTERLTYGLEKMVNSGELRNFLQTHPTTKDAFPLTRFDNSLIFDLPNVSLPSKTPVNNPDLWIPFK